jgi:transforming growth factor-beta-induced protein
MTSLLARTTLTAIATAFVVVVAVTPGVSDARNASTDRPGNVSGVDSDDTTPAGPDSGPAGPFCASIPPQGEGSFEGMADDPVATAASNNPYLTTLTSAVQAAGLVDTLNGEGPFTVFAPNNEAFAAIPPADLDAILADTEWLTEILLYHVVSGQSLSAEDLAAAGSVETAQGEELTFTTEADGSISINGGAATLTCSNITTQNATVHVIDTVLLPPHLSDTR